LVPAPGYPEPWNWAFDVQAEALRNAGLAVEAHSWTDFADGASFDLVMPLVAWGYNLDYPRWIDFLDRADAAGWRMANPVPLLRWNSDKTYLAELGSRGIPTVQTIAVDALDEQALADARRQFGVPELVVKPPISAGAHGTYRLGEGAPIPADVSGQRMLIQPFQKAIEGDGEYSLMLFGGRFSHAIVKRPKAGDFRVQPHLGGRDEPCDPPEGAIDLARTALAAAPAPATYARVDIIRDNDGELRIMELELIEPALFLHHSPDRGAAFASAVVAAAKP
jgi:glutathione synthase/RimK-type ligase-like ATP-grasp enzyme